MYPSHSSYLAKNPGQMSVSNAAVSIPIPMKGFGCSGRIEKALPGKRIYPDLTGQLHHLAGLSYQWMAVWIRVSVTKMSLPMPSSPSRVPNAQPRP